MSTDVHTLAEQARRLGYSSVEHITGRLERMIVRNEAYLSRRSARGTHTSHDDTTAEDMAVIALVILMLSGQASQEYEDTRKYMKHHYTGGE